MRTFEAVSGKKVDKWLVRMVGLLTVNIGAAILSNSQKDRDEKIKQLAIGSAISFTIVDLYYSLNNRISKVYVLDAIMELIMIATMLNPKRNLIKNYNK
jgi:ascorbate-specific PTS system EIIC-type component UlaA